MGSRILDRYVAADFLLTFVVAMVFVTFASSIGAVFKLADLIARGMPWQPIVTIFVAHLPTSIVLAIPLGGLVSCLLIFGRLSDDGEIMAMQTLGLNMTIIIRSTLLLVCGLVAISLYVNHEIEPLAHLARRTEQAKLRSVSPLDMIEEGRPSRDIPGLTIYIGHRKGDLISDVRIYDARDPSLVRAIHARRGRVYETGASSGLAMKLMEVRVDPFSRDLPRPVFLDEWSLDIAQLGQPGEYIPDHEDLPSRALWRSLQQLDKDYPELDARDLALQRSFLLFEISRRSAMAFSSLALVLIGIPLGIRSHRKSTGVGIALSLVIFLVFYLMTLMAQSLVQVPAAHPELIIWIPVILFMALGITLIRKKG
ncbi:MAG: YjgP/YjgQ family permease [Lentisphaerae bacterium]|nr:YjgP/YjgQ family permease [Lentisphaerota bacterium]